jgi:ectoine hydroxylase-related dioxygenase (phytanoyl-CoA dioxygenase family)
MQVAKIERIKSSNTDQIIRALKEYGAVIVEDLLDQDLLQRFNAELDPLLERTHPGAQGNFINDSVAWFFGDTTRHLTGVASKSGTFATEILTHPVYMAVCDAILRPNCSGYQLNLAHVLDRGPGGEQQVLHRDQAVWAHYPAPHPEIQLASVIALADFTAENGATVVAPGSHQWAPDREVDEADLVAAEMPAGSAVVYLGSTVHAGGGNDTTDQWRRGMHMSFCVGWLRPEENQLLTMSVDEARRLPRRTQELLGYGAHDAIDIGGGYLGTVDLQDPVEMMAAGKL